MQKRTTDNKHNASPVNLDSGCIFCGRDIPEGLMVCPICEQSLISGRCSICDCSTDELPICKRCQHKLLIPYDDKDEKN